MTSPYVAHKTQAFGRGMLGVLLIGYGVGLVRPPWQFPIVLFGTWVAARAFSRLIRLLATERRAPAGAWRVHPDFGRATLPRQVFWLLFAIAEADGRAEQDERELVRKFLLERFRDPITTADLQTWEAQRIPPEQVAKLAMQLRQVLAAAECETVFFWACLVAFVDGKFNPDEHIALQQISRGLGLAPHQARAVFHHAKARVLDGAHDAGTWERWERQDQRDGRSSSTTRPRAQSKRDHALATLGLKPGAEPAGIRQRHRELVKRYHPDAHSHLGPVAAEEAERRFREVQTAYEYLSGD